MVFGFDWRRGFREEYDEYSLNAGADSLLDYFFANHKSSAAQLSH